MVNLWSLTSGGSLQQKTIADIGYFLRAEARQHMFLVIAEFGEVWTVHSQHNEAIGLGTQAPGQFEAD